MIEIDECPSRSCNDLRVDASLEGQRGVGCGTSRGSGCGRPVPTGSPCRLFVSSRRQPRDRCSRLESLRARGGYGVMESVAACVGDSGAPVLGRSSHGAWGIVVSANAAVYETGTCWNEYTVDFMWAVDVPRYWGRGHIIETRWTGRDAGPQRVRRKAYAAAAVILTVLAVGCGADSPSSTAGSSTIWLAQASTIEWVAPLVEQTGSGTVACVNIRLSDPPQCDGGLPVSGVDVSTIDGAHSGADGRAFVEGLYVHAQVEQDGSLLVLEHGGERRVRLQDERECQPGRTGDETSAVRSYNEVRRVLGEDENVTDFYAADGFLRMQAVVVTGTVFERLCDLAEGPTILEPLAHVLSE